MIVVVIIVYKHILHISIMTIVKRIMIIMTAIIVLVIAIEIKN